MIDFCPFPSLKRGRGKEKKRSTNLLQQGLLVCASIFLFVIERGRGGREGERNRAVSCRPIRQ